MKQQILSISAVIILTGIIGAHAQPPPSAAPPMMTLSNTPPPKTDFSKIFKDDKEKIGYAIGMNTAAGLKRNLASSEIEYDNDALRRGLIDSLGEGGRPIITEDQEREILTELRSQLTTKMEAKRKAAADQMRLAGEKNKAEGMAFLEKNKTETGVVALPDGLQYKILADGSGPSPKPEDQVTVNYRGTKVDGTEFDSTAKHGGQPYNTKAATGILNVKGTSEALQLMKAGSKWQVVVPPELAFGGSPAGPISPNSTLIFEIELVSIKAGMAEAAPKASVATPLTSDIIKVPSAEEIKQGKKIEVIKAEDIEKEKAKTNQ